MTEAPSLYIVNGYHGNTPESKPAKEASFHFRFAVILGTFNPAVTYMYFQDTIFLEIVNQISEVLRCDEIRIEFDEQLVFDSIGKLSQHLADTPEGERQPPHRICFYMNGELVCIEETEFWALCGGEQPYSDSYTLSFYTEQNRSEAFLSACQRAIENSSKRIDKVIQASNVPIKIPFWKRLFE